MSGHTPHVIALVSILAALKNVTGTITDEDIEEGIRRGYEIPAGWCGYYGACGAGIAVGGAILAKNLVIANKLKQQKEWQDERLYQKIFLQNVIARKLENLLSNHIKDLKKQYVQNWIRVKIHSTPVCFLL